MRHTKTTGDMGSPAAILRNNSSLLGRIAYSILIGAFGTILVFLFLTTFLHIHEVTRFLPWIIAFNTAVTGYCLLDKTRDKLKYKQLTSVGAGVTNVILTYTILTLLFFYMRGYPLTSWDLITFLLIGVVSSEIAALIAIKYFRLSK